MLMFMFFFFNDTATTEIYTLSLHDALPISLLALAAGMVMAAPAAEARITRVEIDATRSQSPTFGGYTWPGVDRKSTRLNSSHSQISYAVFCLKKKTHPAINDDVVPEYICHC